MQLFRASVAVAWLLVMWISVNAVVEMGVAPAGYFFIGDFSHPWRAQFNSDFSMHLLLMAAWIVYRERTLAVGLLCGILAIVGGGAFSLAYIFAATFRGDRRFESLLLGWRSS